MTMPSPIFPVYCICSFFSQNDKEPITLYFNVPGGMMKPGKGFFPYQISIYLTKAVCAALAVFDVMRRMSCPIITINVGLSVGMGAVLCALGTPGKR